MRAASLTTTRLLVRACWPSWNGASGCSGTATSTVLKSRSGYSKMTWMDWRSTIALSPPLIITEDEIATLVVRLRQGLDMAWREIGEAKAAVEEPA